MENTPSNTEASSGTSALDDGFGAVPVRAVRLTLMLEADSLRECCAALEQIAWAAERGELTTGSSGGYGSGYTYELLQNPEQTHERYFAELRRHLAEKTPNDRVEGRDAALSRRVPSHDGLCGNGSKVGAGDTAMKGKQ